MARIQGDLKNRTFDFARTVLALSDELPQNAKGWQLAKQLIRSGTSVGANVREADNALTDTEFAYVCNVARKEAAEAHYWLELCQCTSILTGEALCKAIKEADELTRILSTIVYGTHRHLRRAK